MATNWYMFFVSGLIPLIIGALWYSKMLFGKQWMKVNNFSEEDLQGGNMAMTLGLAFLFGSIISFAMSGIVVHQTNVYQMMMPAVLEQGSEAQILFTDLMTQYGESHRSFTHGALHGVIITLLLIFPIIAINALFERRGWGYILVHSGYWVVTLSLIGGLLCSTLSWT